MTLAALSATRLITERTRPAPVPLVPELRLYTATELTPLWHATAEVLERDDLSPFWAFPWAGGQALARYVLDHPELVRGRRVLDFGAGSGLCAIAAMRAGAGAALACDIDPYVPHAVKLNAALNGVQVDATSAPLLGKQLDGVDVVLAGDIFYERELSEQAMRWLAEHAGNGGLALAGDPGRIYTPHAGLTELAAYAVPTTRELEDAEVRETRVYRIEPQA